MRIPLKERPRRDGNVLPLINIVFLMLIFFLLAGTIAPTADFDLTPAVSKNSPAATVPAYAVYVSQVGYISIAGTEVTEDEVGDAMRAFSVALDGKPLEIIADHEADAALVLSIAEAARNASIGQIKLITLRAGLQ